MRVTGVRQRIEQEERARLQAWALHSAASRGRRYVEPESDLRSAFQRDRDRILHSAAFRRLGYKTQVFTNDEGDYCRTRLTHTMEVAQIGRTLARALGANEDLVEALCLAHDLGHPPFGHAGEAVLNQLAQDAGGFDHNSHSLRIVTCLERRYRDWPGLNLTCETLEGLACHGAGGAADATVTSGFAPTLRSSLEAQIAQLADDLAWQAHDLDDGLQAELFGPGELEGLALWHGVCEAIGWRGGTLDELARHRLIRELIGQAVDDALAETRRHLDDLRPASPQAIQQHERKLVGHSATLAAHMRALEDFLRERMYRHPRLMRMAWRAEHILTALYCACMSEPRLLSRDWQIRLEDDARQRTVLDFIASLTDRSAILAWRRLHDPLVSP